MSNSTMKAAVYLEPRRLKIERVPTPAPGPADVLIRVHACGICGSDVHSYKSGLYIEPGQIMGHEFMGVAAAVGQAVSGVAEGDRVTGFTFGACGHCYWCKRREWTLCPNMFKASTGYGRPGAFAEYVLINNATPGRTLHHIPDNVDDLSAATIEPVGVGIHAVRSADVKPGDKVVVLGAGMIGNACLQAAKSVGASVYVVEVSQTRLQLARESGADAVFDARTGDPLEWVKRVVGRGPYHFGEGGMADVVFEAAGAAQTIQDAFEMVRSGGTICFVGLPEGAVPLDTTKIVHKLPKIVGALGSNFRAAIEELKTGRIRTSQLVTHRFPLDEAQDAFEAQIRAQDSVKVMVTMAA